MKRLNSDGAISWTPNKDDSLDNYMDKAADMVGCRLLGHGIKSYLKVFQLLFHLVKPGFKLKAYSK